MFGFSFVVGIFLIIALYILLKQVQARGVDFKVRQKYETEHKKAIKTKMWDELNGYTERRDHKTNAINQVRLQNYYEYNDSKKAV